MAKRGYTNIMVFREGIPAWKKAGYPVNSISPKQAVTVTMIEPAQLHEHLSDFVIVDVRAESGYEMGYLPGSRAMPLGYLSMLSGELPRDRQLAVVDHAGKQAQIAARWLKINGFPDVFALTTGLVGYMEAGFELEK